MVRSDLVNHVIEHIAAPRSVTVEGCASRTGACEEERHASVENLGLIITPSLAVGLEDGVAAVDPTPVDACVVSRIDVLADDRQSVHAC